MQDALRQSEERFRVALKDSPITVFTQDQDLRYAWIYNPQLYWQHDVLGKTDDELIGFKKAAALNDLKRRVLDSGVGARDEIAVPQNGTSSVFDITIEPLFDAQRNVIGITAACMDIARLREMADRLQESRDRLANTKSYLESEIQTELGFEEIIGQSAALREVLKKARVVAPTDSTVLLLGETGTGKELVARSVHALSTRCDNTFVKLNCAAVPSGLLESELFGHEKGAFTGAVSQKIGRIELAHKGTLFWMKSERCRRNCSPNCCGSCRIASLSGWVESELCTSMCGSSPLPIVIYASTLSTSNFAKICSIA